MAHENKVIRSVEDPSGCRCVDLVVLASGDVGFAEYRRDPEDGLGWRPVGDVSGGFPDVDAALAAACQAVPWLDVVLGDGGRVSRM